MCVSVSVRNLMLESLQLRTYEIWCKFVGSLLKCPLHDSYDAIWCTTLYIRFRCQNTCHNDKLHLPWLILVWNGSNTWLSPCKQLKSVCLIVQQQAQAREPLRQSNCHQPLIHSLHKQFNLFAPCYRQLLKCLSFVNLLWLATLALHNIYLQHFPCVKCMC